MKGKQHATDDKARIFPTHLQDRFAVSASLRLILYDQQFASGPYPIAVTEMLPSGDMWGEPARHDRR
jgi:hypothetical protein